MNNLKNQTSDVMVIKEENKILQQNEESMHIEMENMLKENERLCDDLDRQQTLYNELKKMRGRGEEMDMLQLMEKVNIVMLYAWCHASVTILLINIK